MMTRHFEVCSSNDAAKAITVTAMDFFRVSREKMPSTAVVKVPAIVCLPQMFAIVDLAEGLELKVESQEELESIELTLLELPPGATMGQIARAVAEQESDLTTPVAALLAFVCERSLKRAGLSGNQNVELGIQVTASYLASAIESALVA